MDFDKLTKLVKLANNNPNENEANLAARKVCRIIAEGNFKFVADAVNKIVDYGTPIHATDNFWEAFRGGAAGGGKTDYAKQANERLRKEQDEYRERVRREAAERIIKEEEERVRRTHDNQFVSVECNQCHSLFSMVKNIKNKIRYPICGKCQWENTKSNLGNW